MSCRFDIKLGDVHPALVAILRRPNGDPLNLNAAVNVELAVWASGADDVLLRRSVDILIPEEGQVRCQWAANDLPAEGSFLAEFIVTWSAGPPAITQRLPTVGTFSIVVGPALPSL